MKLHELLDLIDYNRESTSDILQIPRPNSDWDDFDEVATSSALLLPIYKADVKCIQAIAEDVIRVEIDWDILDLYKWGEENEQHIIGSE